MKLIVNIREYGSKRLWRKSGDILDLIQDPRLQNYLASVHNFSTIDRYDLVTERLCRKGDHYEYHFTSAKSR